MINYHWQGFAIDSCNTQDDSTNIHHWYYFYKIWTMDKLDWNIFLTTHHSNNKLDLQSAGSSPNLTYTKISALDDIRIP